MTRKVLISIIIIGSVVLVFGLGYLAGNNWPNENQRTGFFDISLFWEAYNSIHKNFVGEIDYQKLIQGAISGMVDSLNDPHTVFFNSEETGRFLEDADGKFEGVGIELGFKEEGLTVIAPIKGTPAEKAGIVSGDLIVKVGDKETESMSIDEAVRLIRGPKDTEVVLTIFRKGWKETKEIKIVRDVIELPSLEWEMVDNFAHIKFYHFYVNAASDFKRIAREIIDSPAQGIILDLRDNPGGYLEMAEEIGGWFFEKNTLLLVEDYKYRQVEKKTKGAGHLSHYPVVVVINKGSASASEILAGALRDNKESLIVGEKSFGKGSIQKLEFLSDNSSIKITIANWLTPKKQLISGEGLIPDYEVEDPEEQIKKAVELLKEKR